MLLAMLVSSVACGARNENRTEPSATAAIRAVGAQRAVEALCRMRVSGTQAEAEVAFGEAHGTLHEIAAAIEPIDRALAARLLEAKAIIESALEAGETTGLFRSIRTLEERTIDSLTVLGIEVSAC